MRTGNAVGCAVRTGSAFRDQYRPVADSRMIWFIQDSLMVFEY